MSETCLNCDRCEKTDHCAEVYCMGVCLTLSSRLICKLLKANQQRAIKKEEHTLNSSSIKVRSTYCCNHQRHVQLEHIKKLQLIKASSTETPFILTNFLDVNMYLSDWHTMDGPLKGSNI